MVSAAADAAGGGIAAAAVVYVVAAAAAAAAVVVVVVVVVAVAGVLPVQMRPVVGVETQPAESAGLTGCCGEDAFPDRQTIRKSDYVRVAFRA